MYLNRLTLIGFVGADAETKTGNAGSNFTVFSVATNARGRTLGETGIPASNGTAASPSGKLGEFAASLRKGAQVQVEGEFRSREYDKDGVTHRTFESRVESVMKLDRAARQETADAGEHLDS